MNRRFLSEIGQAIRRYPYGAICILLSLLLAGANVWLRFNLRALTALQRDTAREGTRMLTMIAHGPQLRAELTTVHAAVQRIAGNLVVEKNIPDNYGYFFRIEQDTQANLTELQQRPAIVPDSGAARSYKRVPFSLQLNGPFPAIIKSMQRLEYGPRLGRIDGFQMQRTDPQTGNVALQVDFELLAAP